MSSSALRSLAATVVILVVAFGAFAEITGGFAALSADGVRRAALAESPRTLPQVPLVDVAGRQLMLSDYAKPSGQATFVALVYLRCQSVCRTSTAGQAWLQQAIRAHGLEAHVRLLTISFDPAEDTPAMLAEHARRLGADPRWWRFATVGRPQDLAAMLDVFDIVVLPDGLGGYTHNAALFLIDRDGHLARAYDIDRPDLALADYLSSLR